MSEEIQPTSKPIIDWYNLQASIPHWRSHEKTADDPVYQQFLTFTDRDSYLEWCQEWKDAYATLSARIRTARTAWRAEGSEHDPRLHGDLFRSRALARATLELRKASKIKAQALYKASKEAVPAA